MSVFLPLSTAIASKLPVCITIIVCWSGLLSRICCSLDLDIIDGLWWFVLGWWLRFIL
jgi:hypothetical protein